MAKNKTKPTDVNVVDYINAIPHERRREDGLVILEMMERITGHKGVMWGPTGIGFGYYQYKYESGHGGEAALLGFAPRKQHLVLYVLSKFEKQEELLQKLGKHKTGNVCLYINKLTDVDLAVLEEIITASWDHRKHKNEKPA